MDDVEKILAGKYPTKLNIRKVIQWMREKKSPLEGVIYLEGQKSRLLEDSDGAAPFRQRRNFFFLTGCNLPDCLYTYDIRTDKSILYIPPVDSKNVIWSGLPISPVEALSTYDADEVRTTNQIKDFFEVSKIDVIWTITNQQCDLLNLLSSSNVHQKTDCMLLKEAIEECRVIKNTYEIALIKKANAISTVAHQAVLQFAKNAKNEQELLAVFLERCIALGAKEQAYPPIVASGTAAATLHYVRNDQPLAGKLNILLDAGAEYGCYASDITRTFPIRGKFSLESRAIYDIVLEMQKSCASMLKEGVIWDEVHLRAHEVAIEGLLKLSILQGEKENILKARTSVAFFPHGLGHYLGMDTHDSGGHPDYNDKDPIFQYLRVRGPLPAGSVITLEPGLYFCRHIIEPYLEDPIHAKYINSPLLNKYWEVGGVRIEDNILITRAGFENLTTAVKDVEEIERIQEIAYISS